MNRYDPEWPQARGVTRPSEGLVWHDGVPDAEGAYWYFHPASHELPTRVRLERAGAELVARFPDLHVPVPLRLLAGGRWARR